MSMLLSRRREIARQQATLEARVMRVHNSLRLHRECRNFSSLWRSATFAEFYTTHRLLAACVLRSAVEHIRDDHEAVARQGDAVQFGYPDPT